ncbi:MAG: MetQ/NlpA family ABC transporter substrate-binding protein [Bowdeniella nasicola]|nr:MetQ/NlpA family ABC transporter substrate-binding protein [Bowdeniella nasicola]
MKTTRIGVIAAASSLLLALSACGSDSEPSSDGETAAPADGGEGTTELTVGASPVPHAEILNFVQDNLAADAGLDLKVVEYTDYVLPNVALSEGDLDANYFQHLPYLEAEIAEKDYTFKHFDGVHIEPYGIYSESLEDISDLPEGAKVGISNDPSNQARALNLLVESGQLEKIDKEDVSIVDYDGDDAANPKKLEFVEAEAAALPRVLPDVDIAIINGNFALEADLKPAEDAIQLESVEGNPYANVLVYDENTDKLEAITKLDELLHSDEVAQFIKETWPNGEVISAKN